MAYLGWLVSHHIVSLLVTALSFWLAASIIGQRRPTGSALAWLLAIFLVPYAGIPLYLVFGGRKYARLSRSKSSLKPSLAAGGEAASAGALATADAHELEPWSRGTGLATFAEDIEWLSAGTRAYEALLESIRSARTSIRIVTFVVGDDPTGRSLLEAMTKRASEGVEVRLLLDDLLRFRAPHDLLRGLRAAGGKVGRFMPLLHVPFRGRSNLRNHRKIALFDGERVMVGGMNLADEYMGPGESPGRWRDLSILLRGDAVVALDDIFRQDWEFACGERLAPLGRRASRAKSGGAPAAALAGEGAVPVEALAGSGDASAAAPLARHRVPQAVVPSGPDSETDAIYDGVLTAIFRAEKRIWVATPYFVPDEPLTRALSVAARRGVDVRIAVPARSNHTLADLAAGPSLRELEEAGATVLRHSRMLHAKAMLTDDALAMVGSANLDMRSLFLDYEVTLFLTGPSEVLALHAWFEGTFAETARGAPVVGRARAQVESVARLLAPLI